MEWLASIIIFIILVIVIMYVTLSKLIDYFTSETNDSRRPKALSSTILSFSCIPVWLFLYFYGISNSDCVGKPCVDIDEIFAMLIAGAVSFVGLIFGVLAFFKRDKDIYIPLVAVIGNISPLLFYVVDRVW